MLMANSLVARGMDSFAWVITKPSRFRSSVKQIAPAPTVITSVVCGP